MTLLEIAEKINKLSVNGNHPFGQLQRIREQGYNNKPRTRKPFAKFSTVSNYGYAYHAGGITELQFNIANKDASGNGKFRYGIAFSFQSAAYVPDPISKLKPIVTKFNQFLNNNPNFFDGCEMWIWNREISNQPYSSKVVPIKDDLIKLGNFVFIGKFIDKKQDDINDKDIETMVEEFDYLLPAYKAIQFGINVPIIKKKSPNNIAFKNLISKYKELMQQDGNNPELYKWECIKHFQDNFDINALDFGSNLKEAIRKQDNIIYQFSYHFIRGAADKYSENLRQMFSNLYDESVTLAERMQAFQKKSVELIKMMPKFDSKHNPQQDERAIAFYLTLMYPEKYCFYMDKIYQFLLQYLPDEKPRKTGEKLQHYNELLEKHLHLIEHDHELLNLVNNTLNDSCYKGESQPRIIFQDILWRCHQEASAKKLVRICWNTNGWTEPSGYLGKSKDRNSHEGKYGFGNEEWLFDFSKTINNYHYGFLQPFKTKNHKHDSKIFDIQLYTIDGETQKRYWVGEVKNLEVLSKEEANYIYKEYKKNGWLDEMEQQVEYSGGTKDDFSNWSGVDVLNVKFRIEDSTIHDPIIEDNNDTLKKLDRYKPYEPPIKDSAPPYKKEKFDPDASGSNDVNSANTASGITRTQQHRTSEINNLHKKISDELTNIWKMNMEAITLKLIKIPVTEL